MPGCHSSEGGSAGLIHGVFIRIAVLSVLLTDRGFCHEAEKAKKVKKTDKAKAQATRPAATSVRRALSPFDFAGRRGGQEGREGLLMPLASVSVCRDPPAAGFRGHHLKGEEACHEGCKGPEGEGQRHAGSAVIAETCCLLPPVATAGKAKTKKKQPASVLSAHRVSPTHVLSLSLSLSLPTSMLVWVVVCHDPGERGCQTCPGRVRANPRAAQLPQEVNDVTVTTARFPC